MTTWITRFEPPATGLDGFVRVAVKDAIDMAGVVTTVGCVAVLDRASPAPSDAPCLAGIRTSGAFVVGKTTLTELCVSAAGVNTEFGTPVNPVAPDRIPGGSMPVPSPACPVPVSLQLVGPMRGEDLLCATGLAIEAATSALG